MKSTRILLFALAWLAVSLLGGCSISHVNWDKSAMNHVKTVAVVLYTVPISIQYRDDPKESKRTGLQMLAAAANANNGARAATLAEKGFIDRINTYGLRFKVMSQADMMHNARFQAVATRALADIAKAKREREQAASQNAASKVIGFLGSVAKASGDNPFNEGVGPEGLPQYGLAPDWSGADSALMGAPGEIEYIKQSIAALGVDAALVINDPGMSFTCQACVGGTGTATTGSAFLVTMVNAQGKPILQMRQWFAFGDGTGTMVNYIVNPLQEDPLFTGHGQKTAQVFASFYQEKGGK